MLRISDRSSFHRHRWDFLLRRRRTPALPVELWEQIFDHILYVPFFLDATFVRPQDFYLFIESRSLENDGGVYYQSNSERRRLRLVCRSWDAILSRKSKPWVVVSLQRGLSISKGAKRVDIVGNLDGKAQKVQWENAYSTSIISYMGRGYDPDASLAKRDLSVLFEQAANLQAVRSFAYLVPHSPLPLSALQNLEAYFGTLTSLILTCSELSGKLHLPNLTTLSIAGIFSSVDITGWWFPSLRHIALGDNYIITQSYTRSHRPFIPGPTDKLQSLVVAYWGDYIYASDSFWTSYPSLQFLGTRSLQFILLSNPPSNHPLAHIHFLEDRRHLFDKVTNAAFRIPNLQTITMQDEMELYPYTTELHCLKWSELYDTCRQKGIRWFNRRGEELHARWRPKTKRWQGLKAIFQN